jgi:hypothetical protein
MVEASNLQARFSRGERTCRWLLEEGDFIGEFTLLDASSNGVVLDCRFRGFGIYYPYNRTVSLPSPRRNGALVSAHREYFECPLCHAARSKLFLVVKEWGCRVCRQLTHRSSREGSLFRLWREKDELSTLLAGGKPKLMRVRTYEKKLGRLEKVTELIGGRPRPPANEILGLQIKQVWS